MGKEYLLIVATDRLSTHNIVHESLIPMKGQVLTALTVFWLTQIFPLLGLRHHLVAYGKDIFDYLPGKPSDYPADLDLRAIVVERLSVLPIEFIFRGYMSGSFYDKYYSKGIVNPYGITLPTGLQLMSKLSSVIFTPTEKSETDDPLESASVLNRWPEACELAYNAFYLTRMRLRGRGFEQIDGKYEIGVDSAGNFYVVDEIGTPDSCRFCSPKSIVVGSEPPWLDKQIARDAAVKIWGKGPKRPLVFSADIIEGLSGTYLKMFAGITDFSLTRFHQNFFN